MVEEWNIGVMEYWKNACPVKCDACPMKFEVRKHFIRVGAISTGEEWKNGMVE